MKTTMKERLALVIGALALSCPLARAQTSGNESAPAQPGAAVATPAGPMSPPLPGPATNPVGPPDPPPPVPLVTGCPDHPDPDVWSWDACKSWGHAEAGFEALVIRPYFQTNPGLSVETVTPASSQTVDLNFSYPYRINPKVWLGYVTDCGLGCRLSWWSFEQHANAVGVTQATTLPAGQELIINTPLEFAGSIPIVEGSGGAAATSSLRLNVWDVEATQVFHLGSCQVEGSAGIRYAHLAQNCDAFLYASEAAGSLTLTEKDGHNFDGFGPTWSVDMRRPVCYGLGLFANLRGSALFGRSHVGNVAAESIMAGTGQILATLGENADQLSFLVSAEAELGVDFTQELGHVCFFAQAGITAQLWLGAGSATSRQDDMTFFGYTLAVGITY